MLNMFGRDYEEIGSSDKGLILKSSGKIKIQWGRKFIDLLDSEGNINIKLIKKKEEEPQVEEEQTQEEEQTTTSQQEEEQASARTKGSVDENEEEESNNIYVSFTEEQDTSKEQKYIALKNLGLVFKTQKITNKYPKSGLVYIEDEQQLYIVDNGSLIKYNPEQSVLEEYLTEINNLKDRIEALEQQIESLQIEIADRTCVLACDPEDNQNNN